MIRLTLTSLRQRRGAFAATFVALFLGAAVVMAFGACLDTALVDGVPGADRKLLVITAAVVGGWAVVLAVFAAASTLTLAVRQRSQEMAVLKCVGATPRQVRGLVVGEAFVVAVLAGLLATGPGYAVGRLVHHLLVHSDQLADATGYRFGPVAWAAGVASTVIAAVLAARVTGRRTADLGVHDALVEEFLAPAGLTRRRRIVALVFLGLGLQAGVLTAIMFDGSGPDAQQTGGQACIATAVGLALLAPALVQRAAEALGGIVERVGGASGWLAVQNLRSRGRQMATALMPIIVFTTVATGTLYMQSIENAASVAAGPRTADDKNLAMLNYVVVGVIGAFAAVVLVNTLVAATRGRSRELAELRLAGATGRQVMATVSLESAVLLVTGVVFGTIASLVTIVPYSIARTDTVWPGSGPAIWLGVVATAIIATMAASAGTARRLLRLPAADVVAR